jgi:Sulfatase
MIAGRPTEGQGADDDPIREAAFIGVLTQRRVAVACFAAGNALLLLAFAAGGLRSSDSGVFGWKQQAACLAGVVVAAAGLALMARERGKAAQDPPSRELLVAAAQLLGLCAIAVAQTLFDLLSDNAEFFAARGSGGLDVIVFTVVVALGPPLLLFGIELLVGLVDRRARRAVHLLFVGGLVALLVLNALSDADHVPTGLVLLVAAYAGAVAATAVWATRPAAMLATAMAPAALLFALLFVTSPGISALFAAEASGRAAAGAGDVPVVMVIFDEFPTNLLLSGRGRIDARRFPNFARLARTSTWYPNATGVADETSAAVPPILTGRYSKPGSLPISSEHPDNLFTLLARTHRLNVHEEITLLCPERLCRGSREGFGGRMRSLASDGWVVYRRLVLPAGLREGLPDITAGWEGFGESSAPASASVSAPNSQDLARATGSGRAERYADFLDSLDATGRPSLDFAHVLLPHVPWAYLPSGVSYSGSGYLPGLTADFRWTGGEGARFSGYQRMLLQARYVDRLLGQLLRRLRETDRFDRAVVVVVADHGAAMRPNEFRRRFTAATAGELAGIPLFIKRPGQRDGRAMMRHVRTLDVLPTIADLVGARLPWRTDGRSLASGSYPEPAKLRLHRVFGGAHLSAGVDAIDRQRAAALAEQLRLFGTGSSFPGLGGPGRRDELIGKRVADVGARPGGAELVVADAALFQDVDPASGVVPAFVTGGAPGLGLGDHREVAVAVNGRVAAVGQTFDTDDGQTFAIMVPDRVLRPGRNDVRAFEVGE